MFFTRARLLGAALAATLTLALTGCSGSAGASSGSGKIDVVVSFYALDYLATEIGGDRVHVLNLTRPGAEPHDLELTPRDVVRIAKANAVLTLTGFQPAMDAGIAAAQNPHVLDVTKAAGLHPLVGHEAEHEEHDAAHHDDELAPPLDIDPHFWLDPRAMNSVAGAVSAELASVDPSGAAYYRQRADALQARLAELTTEVTTGLAHCTNTDLVTSHAAYGHLANLIGFTQHPLALSPDVEPTPSQLAAITMFVREHGTTTIYTEPLASPKVADVVASETGVKTAVLDPIEGLTNTSAARDYVGLMRVNLATLITGQGCS